MEVLNEFNVALLKLARLFVCILFMDGFLCYFGAPSEGTATLIVTLSAQDYMTLKRQIL